MIIIIICIILLVDILHYRRLLHYGSIYNITGPLLHYRSVVTLLVVTIDQVIIGESDYKADYDFRALNVNSHIDIYLLSRIDWFILVSLYIEIANVLMNKTYLFILEFT